MEERHPVFWIQMPEYRTVQIPTVLNDWPQGWDVSASILFVPKFGEGKTKIFLDFYWIDK